MAKLNIAHHKSYHPYRRDNIERVRKDEEEARLKEEKEEGRMRMADAEARIDLLRERAGAKQKQKRMKEQDEFDVPQPAAENAASVPDSLVTQEGHINLFAPLEAAAAAHTAEALVREQAKRHPIDKKKSTEEEGVALAPSKLDLKPWYVDEHLRSAKDREGEREREERRAKDLSSKASRDPMRGVEQELAKRERERGKSWTGGRKLHSSSSTGTGGVLSLSSDPAVAARLAREAGERQRAEALLQRKRREAAAGSYPSSVASTPRAGYGDVFNVEAMREVEAAKRERRERVERWDRERERDREVEWERDRERERRYWDRERREEREVDVGRRDHR
ncbi:hypothetical protein DACRYDRAFT_55399 [Dacryopinax primogenitus]|uniref:CBF1-interacting co-repressor CIR N-terminal domain-containing protein n=1 Tax=Dacryopinax primogenitus (strain DJM 731) TaxID=1858805 RepID=M5G1M3_DACPD|nr:uncharacterized protein DACRYDRAFT_55399 [Dacryopinax primogenitus]EJT99751.1 hypothetical protein DACRYDRAFT_55399 [Dacryopinax primogenitus]